MILYGLIFFCTCSLKNPLSFSSRFQTSRCENVLWRNSECLNKSVLKSALQPPLAPLHADGLQAVSFEKIPLPPRPAFICRLVGECWKLGFLERLGMERIETKTSPCREAMSLFPLPSLSSRGLLSNRGKENESTYNTF